MSKMGVQEGQDIFAADFIRQDEILKKSSEPSDIQSFYDGRTILLTGATGFLGKILLEKLLRSCSGIKRIYLLLRSKKGKTIEERLEDIFKEPVYDMIRRRDPDAVKKVTLMDADLTREEVISEEGRQLLIREVDVIFHCAATVRFDEKLSQAVTVNVKATMYFINLAKEIVNLKAFVHVSTAYSFSPYRIIPEKIISPKYNYKKIVELLNILDENVLDEITPQLLGEWTNTYVFTKAIAEHTVKEYGKGLPIGVFRPSIVVSTNREPLKGWANNYYGPQGVVYGAGMGVLRVFLCDPNVVADMVPVDMTCNAIIAFAWDLAQTKGDNPNFEKLSWKEENRKENSEGDSGDEVTVMNYVSSNKNQIRWQAFMDYNYQFRNESYTKHILWHSNVSLIKNKRNYEFQRFFCHTIPAVIVDGIALILGKKPILLKTYKKIHKFSEVLSYFSLNSWQFEEKTGDLIWNKMSEKDRDIFFFNMAEMDWENYISNYIKGLRVYLVKDDMSTLPQGRKKAFRLMIAHYTLLTIIYLIGLYMLWRTFSMILGFFE